MAHQKQKVTNAPWSQTNRNVFYRTTKLKSASVHCDVDLCSQNVISSSLSQLHLSCKSGEIPKKRFASYASQSPYWITFGLAVTFTFDLFIVHFFCNCMIFYLITGESVGGQTMACELDKACRSIFTSQLLETAG